jgi:cytochrome c peroxidase
MLRGSLAYPFLLGVLCFSTSQAVAQPGATEPPEAYKSIFQPLPMTAENPANPLTPEKIALGKSLYNDARFSQSKKISCNSCHLLSSYGVDHQPTSNGHKGQRGSRNAPTVYNAALHFAQFWDGRAKDVEEQALGPIMNPVEMAMGSETDVLGVVKSIPLYVKAFKKVFPEEQDPVTFKNLGKAIGAFERTLITPTRFDAFLKGDPKALTPEEKKGLALFRDLGCVACHNSPTVGGQMYQKIGLVKEYPTKDLGRYGVTKNEADKYFFKVPSLRNIEKTGPYFHDGQVNTLKEAVTLMGRHQLGRELNDEQINSVIVFLKTLTAKPPRGTVTG